MAKLILSAYDAERNGAFLSVKFLIFGEEPFPQRVVDIKRAADAAAELERYKADAAATGKPLAISMRIARGDRSPPGFKALKAAAQYETVNL
jgi:hypothetical protein